MIQKPRGTMDILPDEAKIWEKIETAARKVAKTYGFGEIRVPTFESTELFLRGVGDTTDVVQKEMYTFADKEGRNFTLRPEGTASVVRALIENGLATATMPQKLFYIINCFRYEKPEAGRSREFYQFGGEIFGAPSPLADANAIAFAYRFFEELNIKNVKLHINSIGCKSCRPTYQKALFDFFSEREAELCDTCRERLRTNPQRILDCKSPICKEIGKNAPKTIEYLCDDCAHHMEILKSTLDKMGIEYEVNPKIVRGLDYYTRTVFEFISDDIGAQSTICGGGRYDGLVESLDGPALCGIGFGMGITRLILAIKSSNCLTVEDTAAELYIASMGDAAAQKAFEISESLRRKNIYAECDIVGRSLKAQMKYADKIKAKKVLILGENEINSGKAVLKNMETSEQTEIEIDKILDILQ